MNSYIELIHAIAANIGIAKGDQEREESWRARVIYSVLGQMAYSSLYDLQEDLQPVSITHFKQRIALILHAYQQIDTEMIATYSNDSTLLCNEIYNTFLSTGQMYHSPHRIAPAKMCLAEIGEVVLARGLPISAPCSLSGLGRYITQKDAGNCQLSTVAEMFQISPATLNETWTQLLSEAVWTPAIQASDTEYLRMSGNFRRGYWDNTADRSGAISMARIGLPGSRLYYLYRFHEGKFEQSQLPRWKTEGHEYREISNSCYNAMGTLPAFKYESDGALTYVEIGYLPPASILNLLKLYSWPTVYTLLPHDFCRIFNTEVFEALRLMLENKGYQFVEG